MPDPNDDMNALLAEYAEQTGEVTGKGETTTIAALANEQLRLEEAVKLAKLRVQTLEEELRSVSHEALPDAMQAAGVSEFKLTDGSVVTVKEDVSTSILADKRQEAYEWLNANGHGSIVKHLVSCQFGKGEDSEAQRLVDVLVEAGFEFSDKEDVNYQTLQKWGRDMAAEGVRPPEDFFNSFDLTIAKVKPPK